VKVAAITPRYPPASRVGAWLATHRLMRHVVERGHHVHVFAQLDRAQRYELDGVVVDTGLRGASYAHEIAADADVVVSHCGDGGFGAEVAAAAGRPSVRMAHGGGPHGALDAALVVFNSESLRDASDWSGPSIVVRPYVDPAEYRTKPGDCITLVNLAEAKGGGLFGRLARAMPDRPFLGVRGGYGAQQVPPWRNVTVIGPTSNMRDDVYARTRVLLMPSLYETWGMVGVEAMASGIPVIASPTPGLRESLGAAARFAPLDDPHDWVAAIDEVLGDWPAWSRRAKARSRELARIDDRDRFVEALERVVAEFGSTVKMHQLEIR